jgi:diguanylate cyclase (GGDEF)-like protein/PAS domain S-box-containing protein
LDYRIAPTSFNRFSYVDILQGHATPNLSGKTVLIGATAIELGDTVPVPVHRALPGIVVQAIAYETAMRAPIHQASFVTRIVALLIWAFACVNWLSRTAWRTIYIAGAALLSLPLAASWIAYDACSATFATSPFLATLLTAIAATQLQRLNIESLRSWRASLRLRHQDALLQQIVTTSIDGILTVDDAGRVRDANSAAAKLLNTPMADLAGRRMAALVPSIEDLLRQLSATVPLLEHSIDLVRSDGSSLAAEVVLTWLAWEDTFVICVCIRDISAHRERERELRYHATHDGLTGLPNRRLLAERLESAVNDVQVVKSFALLMLDLDGFKQVNDTFGHGTGDSLLIEFGKRLQMFSLSCQCVARVGGDEFALLLTHAQTEDLQTTCDQVRRLTEVPTIIHGVPISLGTSIGVSLYPQHGSDGDSLMRRADIALYSAKRKRTTVEVYDNTLDIGSPRRLQMLTELRSAISRNELTLHFQPKVLLSTAEALEVEALCRWHSPVFGDVPAGEFIPLVEASELIRPFTEWTLRHALDCCQAWRAQGCELTVAVNLSPRHLQDEQLPAWLSEHLRSSGIDPGWLELEITESAIMTDVDRALKILRAIRGMGVALSIDDYGTGYSSLAYLQKIAANRLKIDQSFVAGLGRAEHDKLIVKSTIELAHGLGLDVIAEGIETQAQYSMLQLMGCDYGQGYFIAPPMPFELLLTWYEAHQQPHVALASPVARQRADHGR